MILNITPDHLDRHGTFENYARKERIFANQTAEDCLVLNARRSASAAGGQRSQVAGLLVQPQQDRPSGSLLHGRHHRCSAPRSKGEAEYRFCRWRRSRSRASIMSRMCWPRSARRGCVASIPAEVIAPRGRALSCCRAPARICRHHQRSRLLQRLQGHQRRRHDQGDRLFPGKFISSSAARTRTPTTRQLNALLRERVKAVYTIGAAAEKIEGADRGRQSTLCHAGTLEAGSDQALPVRRCRATSCCWLRPAPASTNLKTTNSADGSSKTVDGSARSDEGNAGVWQSA